jgi:hypothetical protein
MGPATTPGEYAAIVLVAVSSATDVPDSPLKDAMHAVHGAAPVAENVTDVVAETIS